MIAFCEVWVIVRLLFAGVPIAFAFGVGTLSYLAVTTSVPLSTVAERMSRTLGHPIVIENRGGAGARSWNG